MSIIHMLAGAVSSLSFVALTHYIFSAHFDPEEFVRRSQISSGMSFIKGLYFGLAWVGAAILSYGGTKSAFFWLPQSWGWSNSDGDYLSLRQCVAIGAALLLTPPMLGFIYRAAADRWYATSRNSEVD